MNLWQLKYFVSAAKLLNFTKAAEENFVTQQTLSQQIAALETELGMKLFMRSHNYINLTSAGKTFYNGVKHILNELNDLVIHMQNLKNYDDTLVVGYSSVRAHPLITNMIQKISHSNEKVSFITVERTSFACISLLEKGVLDIIFTDRYNIKEENSNIEFLELESANHGIFVSRKHPLAKKTSVNLADIKGERFIQIGSTVDNSIEAPSIITELVGTISDKITAVDRLNPLLLMVANNLGVAILPQTCKKVISEDIVCVEINDFDFVSKFGCAYLKDNMLVKTLIDSIY